MENISNESMQVIYKDLGLDPIDSVNTEDQILEVIAERVRFLLDHDIGLLFSYMYRMDVLEVHIDAALKDKTNVFPDMALAKLILDRQMQRMKMREQYKVDPIEGWQY